MCFCAMKGPDLEKETLKKKKFDQHNKTGQNSNTCIYHDFSTLTGSFATCVVSENTADLSASNDTAFLVFGASLPIHRGV